MKTMRLFFLSLFMLGAFISAKAQNEPNRLAIDDIQVNSGTTKLSIPVKLFNTDVALTGFQFDIVLPAGLSIERNPSNQRFIITKGARLDESHTITSSAPFSNKPERYRVLVKSDYNDPVIENSGDALIAFSLLLDGQIKDGIYNIKIDSITLASKTGASYKPTDITTKLTIGTPKTITFNSNGGSAIADTSVFKGGKVAKPANPTKSSAPNVFAGWYKEANFTTLWDFDTDVVGDANITLYAKWANQLFTVSFEPNNGSTLADQQIEEGSLISQPTATKLGHTLDGWFTDSGFTTQWNFAADRVAGVMKLYAKWTINSYAVTFNTDGGSAINSISVNYDGTITRPTPDPTKHGFNFDNWYKDAAKTTLWNFASDKVTAATTLYAKWSAKTMTVTFETVKGTVTPATKSVTFGQQYGALATATRPGATFLGWFTALGDGGTKVEPTTVVSDTANHSLHAKWDVVTYAVTYVVNGGNPVANESYESEVGLKLPQATRTGYTFKGWFDNIDLNGTVVDSVKVGSTGAKTFYAKWEANLYVVILEGTETVLDDILVRFGKTYQLLPDVPAKTGFTALGWFTDDNKLITRDSIVKIAADHILTAKYDTIHYSITYHLDGGINSANNPATYNVETPDITLAAATKRGYTFNGWFKEAELTTPVTTIPKGSTGNVTLYAKYTTTNYTITYELDGGTNGSSNPANYTIATDTITLAPATKAGHTFNGWFAEPAFTTPVTKIAKGSVGDTTLYAKWTTLKYVVKFNSQSTAGIIKTDTVEYNSPATAPTPPTLTGYNFDGWFKEATGTNKWDFTTDKVTQDTTLFAKWSAQTFTVSGTVSKGNTPKAGVTVILTPFASAQTTTTNAAGEFSFASIPRGNYQLKAISSEGDTTTVMVRVESDTKKDIVLNTEAAGEVEIKADTPEEFKGIVADSLQAVAEQLFGESGGTDKITVTLVVDTCTDQAAKDAIKAKVDTKVSLCEFVDLSLLKIVGSAAPVTLESTSLLIEVVLPIPTTIRENQVFYLYRYHNSQVDIISIAKNEHGEYIEVDNSKTFVRAFLNRFSAYALGGAANEVKHTVSFDFQDGSAIDNVTVEHDDLVTEPALPTRTGYTFSGWYKEAACITPWTFATDKVLTDMTLYAKWTLNTYIVSFDSQGGTGVASQTVAYNSRVTEPAEPIRGGYTFWGWYTDAACTKSWMFSWDVVTDNMILYARWELNTGINDASGDGVRVSAVRGTVVIDNAPIGSTYTFYNLTGASISNGSTSDSRTTVNVAAGIYIVRVGSKSFKIIVP